ncbi:MAG TPA: RNA polymerase sigma factor [Steroidobacteraceae bacterium]|nr:RNA polymerase sigma factor [Steroidobacteraceae bacterium]
MLTLLKSWAQPDAFHSVMSERGVRWYNACLRITRDADLAADAVQEALLKAWDHREEFRGEAALDSWIHRIALNAAIDLTRRRKRRAEDELDDEAFEAPDSSAAERDHLEESFGKHLSVAMQRLTSKEQQIFVLKHIEGWKLEEIAESLQTPIGSVKNGLFRAVRKLRVDLQVWRGE